MWFSYGRIEGFPTQYAPNKNPVTVDVLEAGLILSFVILAVCFYIILIGARGKSLVNLWLRVTISLTLGAIVIVGNFGQEWEIGHIKTPTAYKIGTGQEIHADISVKVGFRSVNVTLKADSPKNTVLENEKIDYNERFEWTWDQGRFGFGPYAGHLQRSFREAQYKGLPLPILWVVDYFVFDGEGLRFGRFYRTAGWYAHITMWTAFACWILANILFRSVIRYGVNFLAVTGLLQLLACLIWGVVKNPQDLSITFESGELVLHYGSSFYITLIGGIICCVLSVIIFVLNIYKPDETAEFFGIDPLSDYDEYHLSPSELDVVRQKTGTGDQIQMTEMGQPDHLPKEQQRDIVLLKRRSTVRFGKKNLYRNVNYEEDIPIYSNLQSISESETLPLHPSTSSGHKKPPVLPPKRIK